MRNIFLNPKLNVPYKLENAVPPYPEEASALPSGEPDKVRSSYDMVFWHKAPIPGIQ